MNLAKSLRRFPGNIWALSLVSFLRDVASEMLVHLLPLFLANVLGVRISIVGIIEGIAETTSSLVKIYSGWLSDRLGKRKGLTVAGYSLSTLAMPLLLVAQSWPVVLLYRFLDRVGKGIRTAPRDALIADSVRPEQRGASFGLHRAADSGGAFVGLLLAMLIVWRLQAGQVQLAAETFRIVVLWSLIPATLAVVVLVLWVKDIVRPHNATLPSFSLTGLNPTFNRFLLVLILFTLGNSSDAFLVLRAQSAGASVLMILGMIAVFNLVYTLLAGPAGALSDRMDRRRVITVGWLIYTLVYLGFAVAKITWQYWLLYALYGMYYALTEGVAKAYVADLVPQPERRGSAFGLYNGVIGLTLLPASVLAGVLWQGIGVWSGLGPAAPFLFGGLLSLIAVLLLWFWVKPRQISGENV
ncbi:MAG: MFS transporter [Caldilineales bacterium]|nr:MFS transporter [Caldilineales bacterium]